MQIIFIKPFIRYALGRRIYNKYLRSCPEIMDMKIDLEKKEKCLKCPVLHFQITDHIFIIFFILMGAKPYSLKCLEANIGFYKRYMCHIHSPAILQRGKKDCAVCHFKVLRTMDIFRKKNFLCSITFFSDSPSIVSFESPKKKNQSTIQRKFLDRMIFNSTNFLFFQFLFHISS